MKMSFKMLIAAFAFTVATVTVAHAKTEAKATTSVAGPVAFLPIPPCGPHICPPPPPPGPCPTDSFFCATSTETSSLPIPPCGPHICPTNPPPPCVTGFACVDGSTNENEMAGPLTPAPMPPAGTACGWVYTLGWGQLPPYGIWGPVVYANWQCGLV